MKKTILILALGAFSLAGCKKSGCTDASALNYSKDAKKDDGSCFFSSELEPDAYVYNYTLGFDPGETFESYTGIDKFEAGDVVVTFAYYEALGGSNFFTELPFTTSQGVYIFSEFSESSGMVFINTTWADGTPGSPWASATTIGFKSVLIKSSGLKKNPDLDITNFEEVKKTFKL